jgi:hypothetical protein
MSLGAEIYRAGALVCGGAFCGVLVRGDAPTPLLVIFGFGAVWFGAVWLLWHLRKRCP